MCASGPLMTSEVSNFIWFWVTLKANQHV